MLELRGRVRLMIRTRTRRKMIFKQTFSNFFKSKIFIYCTSTDIQIDCVFVFWRKQWNNWSSYKCTPSEAPFYKGELQAMLYRRSTTLCVYYKHTEGNIFLRNIIARSYGRSETYWFASMPFLRYIIWKYYWYKYLYVQKLVVLGRIAPLLNNALLDFIKQQDLMEQCQRVSKHPPRVHIYDLPNQRLVL